MIEMQEIFKKAGDMLQEQLTRVEDEYRSALPLLKGTCRREVEVEQYMQAFKDFADVIHGTATKLTLVRKSTPVEKTANFLEICSEFSGRCMQLGDLFISVKHDVMGKPLFALIHNAVTTVLLKSYDLMMTLGQIAVDDAAIDTGILWGACESMKKLPNSNRIAYRREIMENCTVIKYTIAEFREYLEEDAEEDADTGANSDKEFFDEDFDELDVKYRPAEKIMVETCVELIEIGMSTVKLFLQCMPLYKEDIPNINDVMDRVENLKRLTVDVGAELYPEIDASKLQQLSAEMFEEVKSLYGLLNDEAVVRDSEMFTSSSFSSISGFLQKEDPWNLNKGLGNLVAAIGLTRESIFQALAAANNDVGEAGASLMASLKVSEAEVHSTSDDVGDAKSMNAK